MLGPLRQDANLARDVNDAFNLVALLPVIWYNLKNWSCSSVGLCIGLSFRGAGSNLLNTSLPDLWHGEVFHVFWWLSFGYFVADVMFLLLVPQCVKSPRIIFYHHIATIGYICVPKCRPEYGWLMGAC